MVIDKEKIILKIPERGLNLRKIVSLVNVLFFWAITLYLMRSLLLLFGWAIILLVFGDAFSPSGIEGMVQTLTHFYFPIIAFAAVSLWSWAAYNRYRYGGSHDKRRVHPQPLELTDVSAYTRLPLEKLEEMREAKVLVCYFDERKEVKDAQCFDFVPGDDAENVVSVRGHAVPAGGDSRDFGGFSSLDLRALPRPGQAFHRQA